MKNQVATNKPSKLIEKKKQTKNVVKLIPGNGQKRKVPANGKAKGFPAKKAKKDSEGEEESDDVSKLY